MLRALLSTIMLLTITTTSLAQTTLRGRVLDAVDSIALVGVTVISDNESENAMCDADGYFRLTGIARGFRKITFTMLGYKSFSVDINITSSHVDMGSIFMSEQSSEIDAVVVKSDVPIAIQKGDTTQFNAEAFKTNPDADADELLMKMPGVVIQDGKIEAQGEPVRKIYVDGKLFFGTDPMAALKSLPADAIESIQLFDEMSEQARITGFDDGETAKAINIVTKTKSNKNTIVKMESSAGLDAQNSSTFRYLIGGNISLFREKDRITITALANNVNTMKFGENELAGDVKVDNNGNLLGQPTGLQKINGIGINYSRDVKTMRFSGSYFFDNNSNETERISENNYYANPPKFDSKSVSGITNSTGTSNNHRLNFRLELKPNPKNTFIISPDIRIQSSDYHSSIRSLTIQNEDSLNRVSSNAPNTNLTYSITGNAIYVRRFDKKGRSVSVNLNYSLSERDSERYQIETVRQTYNSKDETWKNSNLNNRFIDQKTTGNLLRIKASYIEPFANAHRLQFNYIMSTDWGGSNKQNNKFDPDTNDYTKADSLQYNDIERSYNSIGAGVGYGFSKKPYNIDASIDYVKLYQKRDEFTPIQSHTYFTFNDYQPTLSFRYTLNKSRYVKIYYRGRIELPRIEQMQNVIDDSSPMNIRIGNPDLKEGYRHTITAFYNSTNTKKSTNLTCTLTATTISNFVTTSTESMPTDRDTTIYVSSSNKEGYIPIKGAFVIKQLNIDGYINAKAAATYSFALKAIRSNMNISLNYNYIRTPSIYTTLNYANINSGGLRIGLTSNISQNVDFNIYSNTVFNYTNNTAKFNTSFLNQNIYLSTNIILLKSFVLNSVFTWRYYHSPIATDGASSYYTWNLGVGSKIFRRKNGEFKVTAYDIFNQNRNILHYVRNNSVEDVRTNSLGRYVLLRFSYRFNSMATVKSKKTAVSNGSEVKSIGVKEFKQENNKKTTKK